MSKSWQDIVSDKQKRLLNTIPPEWRIHMSPADTESMLNYPEESGILSRYEIDITNSSAVELVTRLADGHLKSVDVTLAFCKRAAIAHQLVNSALEFFPELALAQAADLDAYYETHGKTIGPLHGLPISLKDQFRVKDIETSMGYVGWLGRYEIQDSVLTDILRKAGAVFYVKTNVPQSLMVCETVNNITGRSVNPRNNTWSCGGSSGGEAANVALRGGIIGVGTDIGGSIRVPAAYNFLYGLRPSHGRLPYRGLANSMEGQETVHSVCGPVTHSIEDMRLFIQSVLDGQPWKYDSKVLPIPWRQADEDAIRRKIVSNGLTLGFYSCDDVVLPHPPILRGIDHVVTTLRSCGHSMVSFKAHRHADAVQLIQAVFKSDGCKDIHDALSASGEPAIPNIADLVSFDAPGADMSELWKMQLEKWTLQTEYLEKWNEQERKLGREIDAIVAPVSATAAVRHNQFKYYGYTNVFNLLDFTSVVVPVLFADKTLDQPDKDRTPLSELDRIVQTEYDADAYHGAPVAVQIIGRRLTEEKTMAIAEEVGRLLGNKIAP